MLLFPAVHKSKSPGMTDATTSKSILQMKILQKPTATALHILFANSSSHKYQWTKHIKGVLTSTAKPWCTAAVGSLNQQLLNSILQALNLGLQLTAFVGSHRCCNNGTGHATSATQGGL